MKATCTLTKKAVIRDEGYPIGTPAPCHINCVCGQRIAVTDDGANCPCGMSYDSRGWVLSGGQ